MTDDVMPVDVGDRSLVITTQPKVDFVIAVRAPDARLLWTLAPDGTLTFGEACGPAEAVEWMSKAWNQYGSPNAVREAERARLRSEVESLTMIYVEPNVAENSTAVIDRDDVLAILAEPTP